MTEKRSRKTSEKAPPPSNQSIASEENLLELEGKCTVERASELRDALIKALAINKPLILNMEKVEEADLTFLQLLHAASRDFTRQGLSLSLQGTIPPSVIEAAVELGFHRSSSLKAESSAGDENALKKGAAGTTEERIIWKAICPEGV